MEHRRSMDNFLKYGKLQRRYYLYVFGAGLICLGVFGGAMLYYLKTIQDMVSTAGVIPPTIYDNLFIAAILFFVSFFVYTIIATVVVLVAEGRVGGSTVAIIDVIDQFRIGKYTQFRELRQGDELQPIMDALKALGATLQEKK